MAPNSPSRLVATTIRFDPVAHELIANEATKIGQSFAAFVREAALIRAVMRSVTAEPGRFPKLQGDAVVRAMHEVSEEVVRLARVEGNGEG